jgi:hypothetical protein
MQISLRGASFVDRTNIDERELEGRRIQIRTDRPLFLRRSVSLLEGWRREILRMSFVPFSFYDEGPDLRKDSSHHLHEKATDGSCALSQSNT